MVHPLVSRATSDQLIGPDWAMNLEICNILNRDPGQAKDVIRGLKKRIRHKNSKVQLLSLTLLETVVKNCGDAVHIHVAERGILLEMVKIVKKKQPVFQVKEKILVLIDTWQEAFGGPRARYPQYYDAYQELLRSGAVMPQKSENAVPIFTPPQTHPLTSYPQNLDKSEVQQGAAESSTASDLPTMSLSEVQNAHGIVDVLSEMLNALDPGNREGPKQEVIVDLVEQCRTYKQRVVQLVNTTADEELLRQGLTLNDDLERVLAKHDGLSSGTSARMDKQKSLAGLVDVDDTNSKSKDQGSTSAGEAQNSLKQLLLPGPDAPRNSNGNLSLVKVDPLMDLLSGDLNPPSTTDENALALVPVSQPTTNAAPAVQMDLIVLGDMFPDTSGGTAPNISKSTTLGSASTAATPTLQQQSLPVSHSNGSSTYNLGQTSAYAPMSLWNGPVAQNPEQQQTIFGAPSGNENALPPPPWESQPSEIIQQMQTSNPIVGTAPPVGSTYSNQSMMNIQQTGVGIYTQPGMPALQQTGGMGIYPPQMHPGLQSGVLSQSGQVGYPMGTVPIHGQPIQSGQLMGVTYYPQMQNGQPLGMYQQPVGLVGMTMQTFQSGQFGGYGNGQWPNAQPLDQRMFGLSVHDSHGGFNSTSYQTSYAPSKKPSKPEDKLFGNLVSFAKSKPSNLNSGKTGSL